MKIYGYIYIGAQEQNDAGQLSALRENGMPDSNIYRDKQSGEDHDRPQYKKLLSRLKKKDLLYIKSIDRLGHSYEEILEQWRTITKDKGADIAVLDTPLLDTHQGRDLKGTLFADVALHLLAFEVENKQDASQKRQTENGQDDFRQRQAEGIAAAKARGVRFGRPPTPLPDNFHEVRRAWRNQEMTLNQAAAVCQREPFTRRWSSLKMKSDTTTNASGGNALCLR